uniref:Uncharacterized protein n=1 Tax=Timema poppense TaxID=170557 RepID=A0A7R9DEW9_TIMPO|nr:unnamed protein product [Timema poppensis]
MLCSYGKYSWEGPLQNGAMNKLRSIRDGVLRWPSSLHKSRMEEVIVTKLHFRHTSLTHGFLLRGEPPQVWEFFDALLSVHHILVECHNWPLSDPQEMESYIGHIRSLSEKRADHLESETLSLRTRLECSQQQSATLATLLEKTGLHCIAEESLGEQVAFLIADRAKLMEEIEVIKKLKFANGVNGMSKESELLSEIIKVSSEKEVLRREVSELCDRVQLLEKASRQLEVDNERLAYKVGHNTSLSERTLYFTRNLLSQLTHMVIKLPPYTSFANSYDKSSSSLAIFNRVFTYSWSVSTPNMDMSLFSSVSTPNMDMSPFSSVSTPNVEFPPS